MFVCLIEKIKVDRSKSQWAHTNFISTFYFQYSGIALFSCNSSTIAYWHIQYFTSSAGSSEEVKIKELTQYLPCCDPDSLFLMVSELWERQDQGAGPSFVTLGKFFISIWHKYNMRLLSIMTVQGFIRFCPSLVRDSDFENITQSRNIRMKDH